MYGIMSISIVMMMNLLNGIKVIKNEKLKKQGLRKNSGLWPGILIVWMIGACQMMKRGRGSNR